MQSRRKVISIMESVGMTEKRVKKMLIWEGLLYVSGVICLTLTVGLAITYGVYHQMNYMGTEFWFPTIYFLGAVLVMLVVCIAVPLLSYHELEKSGSLVERIKVESE